VISHLGTYLDSTSHEQLGRSVHLRMLSLLKGLRSHDSKITSLTQYKQSMISEFATLPSFRDLITSLHDLSPVKPIPTATFSKHVNALNPMNIKSLTNLADIEDTVKYCRQLLASYPGSKVAPFAHKALPNLFCHAFDLTNEIKYLDEAIAAAQDHITVVRQVTFVLTSVLKINNKYVVLCSWAYAGCIFHFSPAY